MSSALEEIAAAQSALDLADHELRAAVAAARLAGKSWPPIAEVLGVTAEAVRQRFGVGHQAAWRAKRPLVTTPLPESAETTAPILQRIRTAHAAIVDAEPQLRDAVLRARAAGESWRPIGQALGGVSKQAAYERYGRSPHLPAKQH